MRLGKCAECGELASLVEYDGSLVCPNCKWQAEHPNEPPLY